jgi:hypothetical protein
MAQRQRKATPPDLRLEEGSGTKDAFELLLWTRRQIEALPYGDMTARNQLTPQALARQFMLERTNRDTSFLVRWSELERNEQVAVVNGVAHITSLGYITLAMARLAPGIQGSDVLRSVVAGAGLGVLVDHAGELLGFGSIDPAVPVASGLAAAGAFAASAHFQRRNVPPQILFSTVGIAGATDAGFIEREEQLSRSFEQDQSAGLPGVLNHAVLATLLEIEQATGAAVSPTHIANALRQPQALAELRDRTASNLTIQQLEAAVVGALGRFVNDGLVMPRPAGDYDWLMISHGREGDSNLAFRTTPDGRQAAREGTLLANPPPALSVGGLEIG